MTAYRAVIGTIVTSLALALLAPLNSRADVPRALPAGTVPQDSRLGPLRTLDDYFPFTPVDSPQAWAKRAGQLRRQAQVATGLWPMPTRTPLNPVIHGKIDRDDYTVEKVYFESFPGHFVTGNLYRPKGKPAGQKLPAVLNPHGHWPNGRFYDAGADEVRKQIARGAERFEVGGRYPLQARCVQQARMGCVVFHYDMVGYADSVQLEHRGGVREALNTKENWGFFSPQAELHLQNVMGLQTWNSIRALDFLTSLPDVDPKKVAVTGASGGGTQTFMLVAVDDRPAVSVPVVMVSTAMQGGCTCENAPYLRVGAGNIDIAALAAPRPLGMVGANDWTKEILTKGYPDLQKLYSMLGHPDRVHAEAFVNFDHNYNSVSRTVVYNFLNKHLGLGLAEPVIEREYKPLTRQEMSVWDDQHPKPTGDKVGDAHERALLKWMTQDAAKQIDALTPKKGDPGSLEKYRRLVGGAFDTMIGRRLEDVGTVEHELKDKVDKGSYLQMTSLLTLPDKKEQVPALFLHPKGGWNKQVVVWVEENSKTDLLKADGSAKPGVAKLLQAGYSVVAADLMYQGEFLKDAGKAADARIAGYGDRKEAWQKAAVYTFGYNRALFAQRVHDVLTLVRFIQTDEQHGPEKIHLVGLGPVAGPIAAAARAQAGGAIAKAAIDTGGFRFASLDRVSDPMFLPGAVKYHDVPGLLALSAPQPLWLAGEGDGATVAAAYAAGGQPDALTTAKTADVSAAVDWLVH
jgi:dienelactone hydrolase